MCARSPVRQFRFSDSNPHPHGSRFSYAWEMVPQKVNRIIDYGCYDGRLASTLTMKAADVFAVDRNAKMIEKNKTVFPGVNFASIRTTVTEFSDSFFDAATCLEVLEHVPCERDLVRELARIIRPGGSLILSTPHKGALSVLDTGNFKFRFPWLIKWYYFYIKRDIGTYNSRFVERENDMIGDVSISANMEHKHYAVEELEQLLLPFFDIKSVLLYGAFTPVIDIFKATACLMFGLEFLRPIFEKLDDMDKRVGYGKASYNVLLKCERRVN